MNTDWIDVDQDLAFVQHDVHRKLLSESLRSARADNEVAGFMLTGSLARGDALPGSDLDLFTLLDDGLARDFESRRRDGVLVENKFRDFHGAKRRLDEWPMEVYNYLDGRILYDPAGRFVKLKEIARDNFESYEPPEEERGRLHYTLMSVEIKLKSARDAGDLLKASYAASTSSWQILEGLWAVSSRPMPPNGSVFPHLGDLRAGPPDVRRKLERLFLGDIPERTGAALDLIGWTLPLLEKR